MSAYRDSLSPEAGAVYDLAVARAGAILAASLADMQHDRPAVTVQAA